MRLMSDALRAQLSSVCGHCFSPWILLASVSEWLCWEKGQCWRLCTSSTLALCTHGTEYLSSEKHRELPNGHELSLPTSAITPVSQVGKAQRRESDLLWVLQPVSFRVGKRRTHASQPLTLTTKTQLPPSSRPACFLKAKAMGCPCNFAKGFFNSMPSLTRAPPSCAAGKAEIILGKARCK